MSDDEFTTMRARACVYRKRIGELGSVSGFVIQENVRERLRSRPTPALPPAACEIADEILPFLTDPRLDTMRARMLEREFFGP